MNELTLWVVIGVVSLIIDMATSSFLFIWITIGAIAALISDIANANEQIQWDIFLVVSFTSMAIGHPLVNKLMKRSMSKAKVMEQGYVGKQLVVDDEVIEKSIINFEGIYWTVKNMGTPIRKGDKVQVIGNEDNRLLIEKLE